jgi:hypothetical protein
LPDQLKSAQQELKTVTVKVDVALSKASLTVDAEKFHVPSWGDQKPWEGNEM